VPARAPLDELRLRALLGPRWPRVDVVASTASTNADLLAARGAPDRTLLVAEQQHAGRGRLDRSWVSPPGAGLTFSALFRPRVPIARWGWLPLLAGVALVDAVGATTGVTVALKWPNDLLAADGRKLAGILVQSVEDAAVIGIGLNVSTTNDELPVGTATSLVLQGAGEVDRTELLAAIAQALETRITQWEIAAGDAVVSGVASAYRDRCATLGAAVRVHLAAGGELTGIAADIDDAGRLVVRTPAGDERVGAGDVVHLRTPRPE
jgi:BirA family biotin operon repressor/biotin-[acetyl-CoA-carboxylase] ligase